jgi:hypothetical protein
VTLRTELEAAQVTRGLARIDVQVEPPEAQVVLDIDGGAVTFRGPRVLWLSPGSHAVRAELAGFSAATTTIEIDSTTPRVVTLLLEPQAPVRLDVASEPDVDDAPPARSPPVLRSRALVWTGVGVGIAASSAGVFAHTAALDSRARANGMSADDPDFAQLEAEFARRRNWTIGLYSAGLACLIATGVYVLLTPEHGHPAPLAPGVAGRSAGMAWSWAW